MSGDSMRVLSLLLILSFASLLAKDSSLLEGSLTEESQTQVPPSNEINTEKPPEEFHQAHNEVHQATESYEAAFVKTIVVLVGLLVLVILTVWMFRKVSHGRLRGMNVLKSIKILEKRPLSPKSILYLIEVGGKQVLIAESQLEVRKIATLDFLGNDKDL